MVIKKLRFLSALLPSLGEGPGVGSSYGRRLTVTVFDRALWRPSRH